MKAAKTVEEYIQGFPPSVRSVLRSLRRTVLANAPGAVESISYGMPAYKFAGRTLLYFAAFKDHYSLFGGASARAHFAKRLEKYEGGKGTVRFPLDAKVPLSLVGQITRFRVRENLARAAARASPAGARRRRPAKVI